MPDAEKSFIVTGATGFLGRALVRHLRLLGHQVICPSRANGFDLTSADLDLANGSHVFHLAARTGVASAWEDPVGFHLVNGHGVMRVLESCRKASCSMTYVSGFVYGAPQIQPISESHRVRPNNPYAFSKWAGEEACRFYADVFGVRVNIVRPFNIYGPEQGLDFILPVIVDQVVRPEVLEVVVKDLDPKRDYVHVDDVVSGILIAATAPQGAVFNIGSGKSLSVREVVQTVFRAAGVTKPMRSTGAVRNNEIMDTVADVSALQALGWKLAIPFDKGIETMIAAARKRLADV